LNEAIASWFAACGFVVSGAMPPEIGDAGSVT
jgi:hypothetical protein